MEAASAHFFFASNLSSCISRSRTKLEEALRPLKRSFFLNKNMLNNNNNNNNSELNGPRRSTSSRRSTHCSSSPSANMGVAWFYHATACPASGVVVSETRDTTSGSSSNNSSTENITDNNNLKLVQESSKYTTNQDYVDIIDIEDEDHSFAAFFIGMKTEKSSSPYVKRPLVQN